MLLICRPRSLGFIVRIPIGKQRRARRQRVDCGGDESNRDELSGSSFGSSRPNFLLVHGIHLVDNALKQI